MPVYIKVETGEMADEEFTVESSRTINHSSRGDRTWLAKHCWWAMRNGKCVITYPVTVE